MRVSALDLIAYGHFAGHRFEFGDKPAFHLIYGENEAGKSTTLRALSSVLFGYPHHVIDDFRHDARDMAIGAELVAKSGSRLPVVRRRKGRAALTDGSKPIEEAAVSAFLGGVSREMFEMVFSLDHERLRQYADACLKDGGALGFSLAEAGAGVGGLRSALDAIGEERKGLFLLGGHKPVINQLARTLADLKAEARRRSMSLDSYRKQVRGIEELDEAIADLRSQQTSLRTEISRLERIGRTLPRRTDHVRITARFEELREVPILAADAGARRIAAEKDVEAADGIIESATETIAKLDEELGRIVVDERILARREQIELLPEKRGEILKNGIDLPKRKTELEKQKEIAAQLIADAELGGTVADLDRILPSSVKRRALATLAEAGTKIEVQVGSARDACEEAERDAKAAQDRLDTSPPPADVRELREALKAADKLGDIEGEQAKRSRSLGRKEELLRQKIVALGIAGGGASTLRQLAVPAATAVQGFVDSLKAVDTRIAASEQEIKRIDDEIAEKEGAQQKLRQGGEAATEAELAAARTSRTTGWALVRGRYIDGTSGLDAQISSYVPDGRLAEAYEAAVEAADRTVDVMRRYSEKTGQLAGLVQLTEGLRARREKVAGSLANDRAERARVVGEWEVVWHGTGIAARSPVEMQEWLASRAALLEDDETDGEDREELEALRQRQAHAVVQLGKALEAAGAAAAEGLSFNELKEQARKAVDAVTTARTRHEKAAEALATETARKGKADRELARISGQMEEWSAKWSAALAAAGLRAQTTSSDALSVLEVMNKLDAARTAIRDLERRIAAMETDNDAFTELVSAEEKVTAARAETPIELSRILEAQLKTAINAASSRKALTEKRKTEETALNAARMRRAAAEKVIGALCRDAGCFDPKQLAGIERQSAERQQLEKELQELEKRLREESAGLTVDALFAECDSVQADMLAALLAERTEKLEENDKEFQAKSAERAQLQSQFDAALTNQGRRRRARCLERRGDLGRERGVVCRSRARGDGPEAGNRDFPRPQPRSRHWIGERAVLGTDRQPVFRPARGCRWQGRAGAYRREEGRKELGGPGPQRRNEGRALSRPAPRRHSAPQHASGAASVHRGRSPAQFRR